MTKIEKNTLFGIHCIGENSISKVSACKIIENKGNGIITGISNKSKVNCNLFRFLKIRLKII